MHDFHARLEALNPQQFQAVTTADGPLLVIAGAGSGKTRVITYRIAWLIREQGVAPWEIFAATFTNKAAEEMRQRVARLIPGADAARLSIATFHSLCVGILRREAHHAGLTNRFTICDDGDQTALIKDCMRNLNVPAKSVKPEQVAQWIGAAKIMMLGPAEAKTRMESEFGPICAEVYRMYQERLLANDAVDFDDLILTVVRIFKNEPEVLKHYQQRWRYVLVDEYQDTNTVQFELVRLLAEGHGNICVVGDEDQSIYSWRGAQIENLLRFDELFPGTRTIRLETNYRSTEPILQAAGAVIAHNRQRKGKNLVSERGAGEPITFITGHSERDEAAQVVETIRWQHKLFGRPYRDMAVFYRVNALSRVVEDQLRERGIPYRVIGGIKFYDRAEIKDLLCYLRLIINPRDGVALSRVINKPPRGIGDKTLARIFNEAVAAGISVWDCLLRLAADESAAGLSKKARAGVLDLINYIKDWGDYAANHPPHAVLERVLRDTQYEESLGGGGKDLEVIARRENIGELVSALEQFHEADPDATLADYLERVALVQATDDLGDEDYVSLMTLHNAKGLEFGAVFIVAMEDPIFPSARAIESQGHAEEERRLFYVGITRAKDLLFLSRADSRTFYGRSCYNPPSLFLREVPEELLRTLEDARRRWGEMLDSRDASNQAEARRAPALMEGGPRGIERGRQSPGAATGRSIAQRTTGSGVSGPASRIAADTVDSAEGLFPVGARVAHAKLGAGEVVAAQGAGDRRKITVRFDAGLELEILERYGGLQRVEAESDMPF